MYYELTTISLPFGAVAEAAANVQKFSCTDEAKGELLACWSTEIGALNRLVLLRSFSDIAQLDEERQRCQASADPFGCGKVLLGLTYESYRGFHWMKPARPSSESGIEGPFYEIRTYGIRPGGLRPTVDLWEQYVPPRSEISPCVVAMVALDGPLRFTNIWAYSSLNDRIDSRVRAVAAGIWPPKGGPAHLTTDMTSVIATPTAVSPMK